LHYPGGVDLDQAAAPREPRPQPRLDATCRWGSREHVDSPSHLDSVQDMLYGDHHYQSHCVEPFTDRFWAMRAAFNLLQVAYLRFLEMQRIFS